MGVGGGGAVGYVSNKERRGRGWNGSRRRGNRRTIATPCPDKRVEAPEPGRRDQE